MVLELENSSYRYQEVICLAIQSTFFGLLSGVGLTYFNRNKDGWKLRSFVALQLITNLIVLVFSWESFILNLDYIHGWVSDPMSTTATVLAGFDIMLSQYFLCYHVFRLNRKRCGIICAFFIFAFATVGFALSIIVITVPGHLEVDGVIFHLTQEIFIVLADLIATFFLFRHYRKIRRGFVQDHDMVPRLLDRTSNLMRKVMVLVVNRGVLVTCAQASFFGPTLAGSLGWVPLNASLANVYVLTTLVILNTRDIMRGTIRKDPHDTMATHDQTMSMSMVVVRPRGPQETFDMEPTAQSDVDIEKCYDKE